MLILNEAIFRNEAEARAFVEAHIWPQGPVCPRCRKSGSIGKLKGASTRQGTYKCYSCWQPFTVKIDTVLEASRLPMHLWLQAIFLVAQSDSPLPDRTLQLALGISQKTARVIAYRLCKAMHSSDNRRSPARSNASRPSPGSREPAQKADLPGTVLPRYRAAMRDIFFSTDSRRGEQ